MRQRLSMLKDHRSMEIILWSLQRLTFQEFLHPLTPRSVSLEHLLKLFLIELHESSPICLILLIEGLEFLVHNPSFLCVTSTWVPQTERDNGS